MDAKRHLHVNQTLSEIISAAEMSRAKHQLIFFFFFFFQFLKSLSWP